MKVRITKDPDETSWWYTGKIGEIIEVKEKDSADKYYVINPEKYDLNSAISSIFWIEATDCEEIKEEVKKPDILCKNKTIYKYINLRR